MRNLLILGTALAMSLGVWSTALAQPARQPHAGEIAADLRRLGVAGSVLYVAAHPDDENTRLLAYLAGGRGLRAGYLSMTRGDGGQNLIGTEQDELLGLIRTQELLAARRIDGAEQLFTRARDFGYSKSADETLRIWGRDEVLADVVLAIRRFQPDVDHHALHHAAAQPRPPHRLGDAGATRPSPRRPIPSRFPEQLGALKPWKADRLLHNVSTWNLKPDADMSAYLKLDVGGYDPLPGPLLGRDLRGEPQPAQEPGLRRAGRAGRRCSSTSSPSPGRSRRPISSRGWSSRGGGGAARSRWSATIDEAVSGVRCTRAPPSIPALLRVHEALSALPDSNPWKAHQAARDRGAGGRVRGPVPRGARGGGARPCRAARWR